MKNNIRKLLMFTSNNIQIRKNFTKLEWHVAIKYAEMHAWKMIHTRCIFNAYHDILCYLYSRIYLYIFIARILYSPLYVLLFLLGLFIKSLHTHAYTRRDHDACYVKIERNRLFQYTWNGHCPVIRARADKLAKFRNKPAHNRDWHGYRQ